MIIWIASYPKSGNTWIRSLLSSYLFSKNGDFNFDLLKYIARFSVDYLPAQIGNKINQQERIAKNWIPAQKLLNKDKKLHFLKTHNALCAINGNKFTDKFNTKAIIYIVRDPRNLVLSLTHHFELNYSEALNFITNKKKIIFPLDVKNANKKNPNYNDFNYLGDWASHYNSWKNNNFCPFKIIKYEDLLLDTRSIFLSILNFISKFTEVKLDENKINKSIETTNFDNLLKMEEEGDFYESVISTKTKKKIKFFNLGKKNNWKKLLDKTIVKNIEVTFKKEMIELDYL